MIAINGTVLKVTQFPDGTPKINLCSDHVKPTCDNFVNISWHYQSMDELFTVISVVNHFYNLGVAVNLNLPYIPNARMDRTKNVSEVFTLKWFADIINQLPINRLGVFDPHSYVSEALFNRCVVITPEKIISEVINAKIPESFNIEIDSYFFPDEGAMKRYSSILNERPFTFGVKKRDWATGQILSLDVSGNLNHIAGKNILIVDDICSAGGTFYFSAKRLKELGANHIFLYVSHCENTLVLPKKDEKSGETVSPIAKYDGLIDRVYTTNSIFTEKHEKVEVV